MRHKIVALDNWVKPPSLSVDHDAVVYENTKPDQLLERIKDATIIMTSGARVTRAGIEAAPNLQLVAVNGTGTDHIDHEAIRERGITLCHVPAQNVDAVSEHAFALYYAIKRRILPMHQMTMDGLTWAKTGAMHPLLGNPPRTNSEETLVVIGYGALGKNVEKIAKALGMRVLIAERKGASDIREDRTTFESAIKQGTIFIVVAPLDASTRGTISTPELEAMNPTALIVNVGRGGVIDDTALIKALREGQIGGAATDVFEQEPATTANCNLLDPSIPNLILSPHIAWYSLRTLKGTLATVAANLEAFVSGKPTNVVIPGRT